MCLTRRKRRDGKERRVRPGEGSHRVTGEEQMRNRGKGEDMWGGGGERSEADAHTGERAHI